MGSSWERHRSLAANVLIVGVLPGLLSLCLACGGGREPDPEAGVQEEADLETSQGPARAAPSLSPTGTASVSMAGGRVTIRSHAAPRLDVLRELARTAGFSLEIRALEPREITLVLVEVEPELALERLLEGEDYGLQYTTQADGRHAIARVEAGPLGAVPGDIEASAPEENVRSDPGAPARTASRRARRERQAPRNTEQVLTEDEWARLADPEPEVRLDAVEDLSVMGEGEDELIEILRRDEEALVRAAAASERATRALADALRDPDPRVVVKSIESLRMADEAVIPDLEALSDHPDASVRMAAAEAIEFLE